MAKKRRQHLAVEFEVDKSITKYTDYIFDHMEEVTERVNAKFEENKDFLRITFIKKIKSYLSPWPVHYEWEPDDCPYDHSGILVENGWIDRNLTVIEFLEKEYTGRESPSFESGRGWNYDTYQDDFYFLSLDNACTILYTTIQIILEEEFEESLSEDLFDQILEAVFDEVYTDSITNEFFWATRAVEFVGIAQMKLKEFIDKKTVKHP